LFTAAVATGLVLGAIQPHAAIGVGTHDPTARLTITKGGVRTGAQSVAGLAGAVYDFTAGTSTAPPGPGSHPAASCTTGADGKCSVNVPGRNIGNQGYWISERSAPSGYSVVSTLDTGTKSSITPRPYNPLFTGRVANNTTRTFPEAQTTNTPTARGNYWADSRQNPPMPTHCGLTIALLIDVSGSIKSTLPMVKAAANGFVDGLTGTSSRIALYDFAQNANQVLPPTAVPDQASADVVKHAINGLTAGGPTNWDQALFRVASSPIHYDSVIMLTDGNPTVYGPSPVGGNGVNTRFREVENGIFSANALKAKGTRIIAVAGSGMSHSIDNLKAISGGVSGQDFIQASDAQLGSVFQSLASENCGGTINVIKKVIPPHGQPSQGVPTGGWKFSTSTSGVTPSSGYTADGSGAVSFSASVRGGSSKSVTLTETQKPGFTLVPVGGHNATCTSGGKPVSSWNTTLGFRVDARANAIVTCTVYNMADKWTASVVVNKTWKINGHSYPDPTQPADFQAALQLTGQVHPEFGQTYDGYNAGDKVSIGDDVDMRLLPPGCKASWPSGDLGWKKLRNGLNTFQVTNTVKCKSTLQLIKNVINPFGKPAAPTAWTLAAFPPNSHKPAFHGTTGVSSEVQAGTVYSLGETTVRGYTQEVAPGAHIVPPATGSWHCVLKNRDGSTSPEFDGVNGTVTVGFGQNARCTANNIAKAASLTLKKTVINTHGGKAKKTDWTLRAIPTKPGPFSIIGRDGSPSVTNAQIIPTIGYALSETGGPSNYDEVDGPKCVKSGTNWPIPVVHGVVKAGAGEHVTCTFTNHDRAVPPLPVTGTAFTSVAGVGVLTLVVGAGLFLVARRRRSTLDSD
jgi:Mg-chelatase subunit ChlD